AVEPGATAVTTPSASTVATAPSSVEYVTGTCDVVRVSGKCWNVNVGASPIALIGRRSPTTRLAATDIGSTIDGVPPYTRITGERSPAAAPGGSCGMWTTAFTR